ncbi:hypothetical protein V2J09_015610 [Rumex salicifolius]
MAGAVKGAVGRAYPVENWSDERCGGRLRSSDSVLVGVVLLRSKIGAVTRAVNSAAVGFRRISQIHVVLQCITFLQVLVAAGAASVSIKFWDLKEAKRNSGRLVQGESGYMALQMGIGCCSLIRSSLMPICPCLQTPPCSKRLVLSFRSSKLGVISVSNHALRVPEGVFQNHWMLKAIARADQDHFDEGEAKEAHRLKRKRRLLQKVVDVAHVGCLDVGKGEVGDLVNPTPLAGPEDEVGGVAVGEDAVGEEEDVAFLKRVALVSPQLKVHRCRLISYQSQAIYDNLQSASNWYKTMYKQSEREPRTEARNRRKREIAREGKEMDLMEPLVAGELHNSLVTGVGTSVASVSWSEALEDRRLRFPDS